MVGNGSVIGSGARRVRVTPTMARAWLDRKDANRPIHRQRVAEYAKAMLAGRWLWTGDPLKFSSNGRFLDGQHRMLALIETGLTLEFLVVENVPEEAFDILDTGLRRSPGDQLGARGHAYANTLAAAVNIVATYERTGVLGIHDIVTTPEIIATLARHPGIEASLDIARLPGLRGIVQGALAVALHYLMARSDKAMADQFWNDVARGEMLDGHDPVYLLRTRLLANVQTRTRGPKMGRRLIAAFIVKAWNARREGRRIGTLRWGKREEFPTLRGAEDVVEGAATALPLQ